MYQGNQNDKCLTLIIGIVYILNGVSSEDLNDTLLITWINTCFPVILIITPYTF